MPALVYIFLPPTLTGNETGELCNTCTSYYLSFPVAFPLGTLHLFPPFLYIPCFSLLLPSLLTLTHIFPSLFSFMSLPSFLTFLLYFLSFIISLSNVLPFFITLIHISLFPLTHVFPFFFTPSYFLYFLPLYPFSSFTNFLPFP